MTFVLTFIEIFLLSLAVYFLPNNDSNFFQFVALGRKNTFIRFHEEIKLISWTWCTFPQKSWLKIKMRHSFMDKKAMITTTLIPSYTLVPFCLPHSWKPTFKTNSELLINHTKKQFVPSKITINWLFNCMLLPCHIRISQWI